MQFFSYLVTVSPFRTPLGDTFSLMNTPPIGVDGCIVLFHRDPLVGERKKLAAKTGLSLCALKAKDQTTPYVPPSRLTMCNNDST